MNPSLQAAKHVRMMSTRSRAAIVTSDVTHTPIAYIADREEDANAAIWRLCSIDWLWIVRQWIHRLPWLPLPECQFNDERLAGYVRTIQIDGRTARVIHYGTVAMWNTWTRKRVQVSRCEFQVNDCRSRSHVTVIETIYAYTLRGNSYELLKTNTLFCKDSYVFVMKNFHCTLFFSSNVWVLCFIRVDNNFNILLLLYIYILHSIAEEFAIDLCEKHIT